MADLSHLTVEERLAHLEGHVANGTDRFGCDLCALITRGY
jgi:hypothetical protein